MTEAPLPTASRRDELPHSADLAGRAPWLIAVAVAVAVWTAIGGALVELLF